jgi:hypothetical protein
VPDAAPVELAPLEADDAAAPLEAPTAELAPALVPLLEPPPELQAERELPAKEIPRASDRSLGRFMDGKIGRPRSAGTCRTAPTARRAGFSGTHEA